MNSLKLLHGFAACFLTRKLRRNSIYHRNAVRSRCARSPLLEVTPARMNTIVSHFNIKKITIFVNAKNSIDSFVENIIKISFNVATNGHNPLCQYDFYIF